MNPGAKVALVTGAANGLGRTIATHLAEAGATGIGLDEAAGGSRRQDAELELGLPDHARASDTFQAS